MVCMEVFVVIQKTGETEVLIWVYNMKQEIPEILQQVQELTLAVSVIQDNSTNTISRNRADFCSFLHLNNMMKRKNIPHTNICFACQET